MKAVQYLLRSILPPDIYAEIAGKDPDSKTIEAALAEVGRRYPDQYESITQELVDAGRMASYRQGETLRLADLRPVLDKESVLAAMRKEIQDLRRTTKDDATFRREREKIHLRYSDALESATMDAAMSLGNNLAMAVRSGARGKPAQLKAMLSTPGLYADAAGNVIPIFVSESYGEGLRPSGILASAYGTRQSVLSTKNMTAKGGHMGKIMAQAASRLPITEKDCGTDNGIDVPMEEAKEIRNRVLAAPVAGLETGTILDRHAVRALKKAGVKNVIVRSALTCQAGDGLCQKCFGREPNGQFPDIGSSVGLTAAQAVSEPIAQGALSQKHCLAEGTMVSMRDGTSRAIAECRIGEGVDGSDQFARVSYARITDVIDQGMQPVYKYKFRYGYSDYTFEIVSTDEHIVLVTKQNAGAYDGEPTEFTTMKIGDLKFGKGPALVVHVNYIPSDIRRVAEPEENHARCRLVERTFLGEMHCWDLTVNNEESLFVLANGAIVHNTGGAAKGKNRFGGFETLRRFVESPERFPERATLSKYDGLVEKVQEAPQGGTQVFINGEEHYIPPDQQPVVKVGQTLEAGDALSDGLVDAGDLIQYRGVGESRRYYADQLRSILEASGTPASRRNTEIIARAAIDHVRIQDPEGFADNLPDELAYYSRIVKNYQPPEDTRETLPTSAYGEILQKPALHFSVGTRVTPRVARVLEEAGVKNVAVSKKVPPWKDEMSRLATATTAESDWLAGQHTSYLGKSLQQHATRGSDTNVAENVHFAPRLAVGVGFGEQAKETGKF